MAATEKKKGPTNWIDLPDLVRETIEEKNDAKLTETQWAQVWYMCQKLNLDPLANQIHVQLRAQKDGKGGWKQEKRLTIITGIDGYRLIAHRTGRYCPGTITWHSTEDGGQTATAEVWILCPDGKGEDEWRKVSRTAYLSEYQQLDRNGMPNRMWLTMPHNQLGKCAEALALRTAFPADLAGVYTDTEMEQADNPDSRLPLEPKKEEEEKPKTPRDSIDESLKDVADTASGEASAKRREERMEEAIAKQAKKIKADVVKEKMREDDATEARAEIEAAADLRHCSTEDEAPPPIEEELPQKPLDQTKRAIQGAWKMCYPGSKEAVWLRGEMEEHSARLGSDMTELNFQLILKEIQEETTKRVEKRMEVTS